jgi:nucleotide-binding universal stress UspA family protein
VVVALSGGPEGDTLIRRAARIADRTKGADLLAVHVTRSDGLAGAGPRHLARQRILAESLGGTYHQVVGEDVPHALLEFARAVNATQLVLGVSRRARIAQLLSRGVGMTTTALSGPIDVDLVTHEQAQKGRRRRRPSGGLTIRRRAGGFAVAAPASTASDASVNCPARSRTRNRSRLARSPRSISRFRACCTVQAPSGRAVTPRTWTRRVPTPATKNTWRRRTVTAQQRAWREQPHRPQRAGEQPCQGGEHRTVRPVQLRPGVLPPQHRDLVAQHQQLGVLRRRRASQQRRALDH